MSNDFPDKKKGEILGARHVNNLNKAARRALGLNPGSNLYGQGVSRSAPPGHVQRTLIITAVNDPEDPDPDWECGEALYEVMCRWYNHDDEVWETNEDEGPYCFDPSEFLSDDLSVDDVVPGWWDPERKMFVGGLSPVPEDFTNGDWYSCCTICDPRECLYPGIPISCSLCPLGSVGSFIAQTGQINNCCEDAAGLVVLDYYGGCEWRGPELLCDGFETRWVLIAGATQSTLTLQLADGTIQYVLNHSFNCFCKMQFEACCGPYMDCLLSLQSSQKRFICVEPNGLDYEPNDIACGNDNEYPQEFSIEVSTGGIVVGSSTITYTEDEVWEGIVEISCLGRNKLYFSVSCVEDQDNPGTFRMLLETEVDGNVATDLCEAVGGGFLNTTGPDRGTFTILTGTAPTQCCVGGVTYDVTVTDL